MTHRAVRTALVGLVLAVACSQAAYSQEADESAYLRYEIAKVDPWGPFVLNLLLPFGIGSFVQGDTTGGLIVAGGHVAGIVLMFAGLSSDEPLGSTTWVGAGVSTAASIVGLFLPHAYANAANEKLRRDLGITVSGVSLSEDGLAVTFTAEAPNS